MGRRERILDSLIGVIVLLVAAVVVVGAAVPLVIGRLLYRLVVPKPNKLRPRRQAKQVVTTVDPAPELHLVQRAS